MALDYDIEPEQSLIKATVRGKLDYLSLDKLWKDIAAACERHGCTDILGIADIDSPTAEDAYDHASVLEFAGIKPDFRIAWVETNRQAREVAALAEAVIRNRGLANGRVFDSESAARRWLANPAVSDS